MDSSGGNAVPTPISKSGERVRIFSICLTQGSPPPYGAAPCRRLLFSMRSMSSTLPPSLRGSLPAPGPNIFSCIGGAIGALKGPKHGGANEAALEIQKSYRSVEESEADIRARIAAREVIIGFGHPVYTVSDPPNKLIKLVAQQLSAAASSPQVYSVAERIER